PGAARRQRLAATCRVLAQARARLEPRGELGARGDLVVLAARQAAGDRAGLVLVVADLAQRGLDLRAQCRVGRGFRIAGDLDDARGGRGALAPFRRVLAVAQGGEGEHVGPGLVEQGLGELRWPAPGQAGADRGVGLVLGTGQAVAPARGLHLAALADLGLAQHRALLFLDLLV